MQFVCLFVCFFGGNGRTSRWHACKMDLGGVQKGMQGGRIGLSNFKICSDQAQ